MINLTIKNKIMKQIIVIKPKSISQEDKDVLLKNGCIVIENPNPSAVRIINSYDGLEGDDIFNAAIDAISDPSIASIVRTEFANNILKAFKIKSKNKLI